MNNVLINDDCFKAMGKIPNNSVDFILTDPPFGVTACKWDSVISFNKMWHHLNRLIKLNGVIALMASQPFTTMLIHSNIKMFKYCWVWEKNFSTNFLHAKRQPLRKHEDIVIFYKKCGKYFPIKSTGHVPTQSAIGSSKGKLWHGNNIRNYKGGETTRYPTSILKFDAVSVKKRFHPTQKPVALMEYLIKTYTNKNELVLDFTMGSGTTGVACKNLNRKFIGIELDKEYFEIAKKRING